MRFTLATVPQELVVYMETVRNDGHPLATAVLAWAFEPDGAGTLVNVTIQVTSFVGVGMLEGNHNNHTMVLAQLGRLFTER
ncbi:MAG: hypothetical protein R2722_15205 [Tessaracoccus sp.]